MNKESHNLIEYCACYRLRAAARKVTRDYEEALKPIGLKATQFTLLSMIQSMKPNSLTELANNVGMDRTALNRALSIMTKKHWITVLACKSGLEKKARITESGSALLKKAVPLWQNAQSAFIKESGEQEWSNNRDWLITIAGGQHYGKNTMK